MTTWAYYAAGKWWACDARVAVDALQADPRFGYRIGLWTFDELLASGGPR